MTIVAPWGILAGQFRRPIDPDGCWERFGPWWPLHEPLGMGRIRGQPRAAAVLDRRQGHCTPGPRHRLYRIFVDATDEYAVVDPEVVGELRPLLMNGQRSEIRENGWIEIEDQVLETGPNEVETPSRVNGASHGADGRFLSGTSPVSVS